MTDKERADAAEVEVLRLLGKLHQIVGVQSWEHVDGQTVIVNRHRMLAVEAIHGCSLRNLLDARFVRSEPRVGHDLATEARDEGGATRDYGISAPLLP